MHVLGTPPAFILSQDQTLMFKFLIQSDKLWPSDPKDHFLQFLKNCKLFCLYCFCGVSILSYWYGSWRIISDTSYENLFLNPMWRFIFLEFSGLFHCSIIKVHAVSFCLVLLSRLKQLVYFITLITLCQLLFKIFFKFSLMP